MHQKSNYFAGWNATIWLIAAMLLTAGCRQSRHVLIGVKNTSGHSISNAQIRSDQEEVKFTYGKLSDGNQKLYWWPTGTVPRKLTFDWDLDGQHVEAAVELSDEICRRVNGDGERLIFELGEAGVVGLYVEVINDMDLGNPFLLRALAPIFKGDGTAVFAEFED